MSIVSGHVFAPVGLAEVAELLGEASHDVATVCLSENINPNSLIMPAAATYAGYDPSSMRRGWPMDTYNKIPPPSINSSIGYYDSSMNWGFWVPYVYLPQDICKVMNYKWYRLGAHADYWKCLSHFDGYQHKAIPVFPLSVTGYTNEGAPEITFQTFSYNADEIDPSGKGNKGGVVSVPAVFGTERPIYAGFSVYKANNITETTPEDWEMLGWGVDSNPLMFTGELTKPTVVTGPVLDGMNPVEVAFLVPWVTRTALTAGQTSFPADTRFYPLNFCGDFPGYIELQTNAAGSIAVSLREYGMYGTSSYRFVLRFRSSMKEEKHVYNFTVYYNNPSTIVPDRFVTINPQPVVVPKEGYTDVEFTINGQYADFLNSNSSLFPNISFNRNSQFFVQCYYSHNNKAHMLQSTPTGGYDTAD